jgi:hypothetical protein
MITLNMNEASVAQSLKNAALLSPCHNQNSRTGAVFLQHGERRPFLMRRRAVE